MPKLRASKIKQIVDVENKIAEIENTSTKEFMKYIEGLEDLYIPGLDKRLKVRTEALERILGGST